MALKEFHKIDLNTGERLDVLLFDDEMAEIPEDCKEGWGQSSGLYNPVWSFETNSWIEGEHIDNIIQPLKALKIQELSDECNARIEAGFDYNGDFFQFNMKDQANFNQQLSILLLDDTVQTITWKTENNGVKIYQRQDFIEACKAGEVHKRNNIGRYWQLKAFVETHSFQSVDELNNINFDTDINVNNNVNTGV